MAIFSGWGLKKDSSFPADYAADFQLLDLHIQHRLTGPMGRLNLAINLQVTKGTRLAILGPSGSGKTSLLRILAGLMPVEAGHIYAFGHCWLNTQQQLNLPPRKRKAGLVFQDYALFPHMNALENLLFALPKGRSKARAKYLLEAVGLEALDRQYPNQLSGGQQQRLALARALAAEPELLLLDEPLSALDVQLRRALQDEILDLQQQAGTTLLLVTHDPGEALRLAQRAILLKDGRIVADTTPAKLFAFTQGSAAETLVLQGKVLSTPPLDNPSMGYLVEAEGQICRALVGTGQPLHLGEKVMLSAKQWIAQPFAEPLTSEPLADPNKSADSDGLPSDKSAFPA